MEYFDYRAIFWLVCGSLLIPIYLVACVLSVFKAHRDRKEMKARIEARRNAQPGTPQERNPVDIIAQEVRANRWHKRESSLAMNRLQSLLNIKDKSNSCARDDGGCQATLPGDTQPWGAQCGDGKDGQTMACYLGGEGVRRGKVCLTERENGRIADPREDAQRKRLCADGDDVLMKYPREDAQKRGSCEEFNQKRDVYEEESGKRRRSLGDAEDGRRKASKDERRGAWAYFRRRRSCEDWQRKRSREYGRRNRSCGFSREDYRNSLHGNGCECSVMILCQKRPPPENDDVDEVRKVVFF